ncbi:MAG: DNA repair protein RecO [Verrucomicrobiae bacterium]|nr:DNA repair protein RecO [Verrucomicrobiae bacterium]
MEPRRDEGIVLRKWPVTESSLVVTWFTRQAGKIKTMAKGARRMRGPFVGQLDLFYRDEVLYLPSRRSELHLLTECAVLEPHVGLRESVERLAAAQYVVELVELATEWEDPQPVVFEELAGILGTLEAVREPGPVLVWFEMRLLRWAGWQPRWRADRPEERLLESLGAMNLAGAARVRVAPEQLVAAWRVVWGAWDNSVGREPRTRRLLGKIGN